MSPEKHIDRLLERIDRPIPRHELLALTGLLGMVHFTVFLLTITNRTGPYLAQSPHTLDGWFTVLDAASLWVPLHAVAGFLLLMATTGFMTQGWCRQSVRLSVVLLTAWGGITLIWSMRQHPPVSLLGPVLIILFALLAVWVDRQWDDRE